MVLKIKINIPSPKLTGIELVDKFISVSLFIISNLNNYFDNYTIDLENFSTCITCILKRCFFTSTESSVF